MTWQNEFLDPFYADPFMSTDAILVTPAGRRVPVRARDLTKGINASGDVLSLQSLTPAAKVRLSELALQGISLEHVAIDVQGGQIELNKRKWRINSHQFAPCRGQIADGEVLLLLSGEQRL